MNFNFIRQPRSLKFALFFTVVVIPFILSANVSYGLDVQLRWLDSTEYPTVKAFVTVVDEAGEPEKNLDESNFQLFEDGEEQMPITVEELEPSEKLSVAVAMDYSGSMRDAGDAIFQMEKAVLTFIDFLRDGKDTAEIIKFDWNWKVEQDFTDMKDLLRTAVNKGWDTDRSGTKLYDTLYKAIEDAAADAASRGSLGAVVVVSDGKDQKDPDDGTPGSTEHTLAEVIQLAQDEGIRIITIGFGNIVENVLRSLAEDTDGIYFQAPQAGDFERIFLAVATELIGGYIVSYQTGATGCEDHEMKVIVTIGAVSAEDTETFLICLQTGGTGGGIIDTGGGGGGCFFNTTYGSRR